ARRGGGGAGVGPLVERARTAGSENPTTTCASPPRLHPAPGPPQAADGRRKGRRNCGGFVRLRWLRWRFALVRGRQQVLGLALPVCGLSAPAVAVLPHVGERGFQFRELRFEQLRDALWHAVLVRCRLRWWQRWENFEQFHGFDVPSSVVVARRTDASGLDGAEHRGFGDAGGGRGGGEVEGHCGRLRPNG